MSVSIVPISENNVSLAKDFPSEIYIDSSQSIYLQFGKSRILNGFHNVCSNSFFGFLCKSGAGIRYFNLPASVCDNTGNRNIPGVVHSQSHNGLHFPLWAG